MAEKKKAMFRVVIDGSQQAIFEELTRTDRPLGAIFNSRMHTTGLKPGGVRLRRHDGEEHRGNDEKDPSDLRAVLPHDRDRHHGPA